jgi:hypothetical protein
LYVGEVHKDTTFSHFLAYDGFSTRDAITINCEDWNLKSTIIKYRQVAEVSYTASEKWIWVIENVITMFGLNLFYRNKYPVIDLNASEVKS